MRIELNVLLISRILEVFELFLLAFKLLNFGIFFFDRVFQLITLFLQFMNLTLCILQLLLHLNLLNTILFVFERLQLLLNRLHDVLGLTTKRRVLPRQPFRWDQATEQIVIAIIHRKMCPIVRSRHAMAQTR